MRAIDGIAVAMLGGAMGAIASMSVERWDARTVLASVALAAMAAWCVSQWKGDDDDGE